MNVDATSRRSSSGRVEEIGCRNGSACLRCDPGHDRASWKPLTGGIPMNRSAVGNLNECRELAEGQAIPVQILFELHASTPETDNSMAILALILSRPFMATLALPDDGRIGHICGMPNRIAEWRKAKRLSYKGLSDLVGCDPKTIERLEKGYRRLTIDWMARVAGALGVEPKDLLPQGEGSKAAGENQSGNLVRSRSKDLLIDLIDAMTEEEAQKALQIINLAKEFGGKKNTDRDGGDDGEDTLSRLAG